MVYGGVAKLRKTHASSPRPFIFMHLQQTLADSGVKARSDDALDLGSLPRVRVLLVTITVIRRDAVSIVYLQLSARRRSEVSQPIST